MSSSQNSHISITSDNNSKSQSQLQRQSMKKRIISLVNELISLFVNTSYPNGELIPPSIRSISELKPQVYVYLYEKICNSELIDKIWPPRDADDHVHNTQAVIDSLSLDVLHEDLSYLNGEMVCKPHLTSVEYLLEILKSVHDWINSMQNVSSNSIASKTKRCDTVASQNSNLINPIPIQIQEDPNKRIDFDVNKNTEETNNQKSLETNKNQIFETNQNTDDVFNRYMRQKEEEYKLKKNSKPIEETDNDDEDKKKTEKSSSGNSSLKPEDIGEDDDQQLIKIVNATDNNNKRPRRVNFEEEKMTTINSQTRTTNTSFNDTTNNTKIEPLIETIDNELKIIRDNLSKLSVKGDSVNSWLKRVYEVNLESASDSKPNNNVNRPNSGLNRAKNEATDDSSTKSTRSSLRTRSSALSKSVLLPRSKSLVNYAKFKRDADLSSSETTFSDDMNKKTLNSSRYVIGKNGIMLDLLDEFPHLHTKPETMNYLWSRHAKFIEMLSRNYDEIKQDYLKLEDNKMNKLWNEAYSKQAKNLEIMQEDLAQTERINNLKREQLIENSVKAENREDRIKSAKIKRYVREYIQGHRARMLKQSTNEELVFKRLFEESLKLQKERMLEMKKYVREKSDLVQREQNNKIQSIENAYKNKFAQLNEKMKAEKTEKKMRDQGQKVAISKVKRTDRRRLVNEIGDLQEQMAVDKDSLYWRQVDAERAKLKVLKASYDTRKS